MSKKKEFSNKDKKEFNKTYNKMIENLQVELVQMQDWVIEKGKRLQLSSRVVMLPEKVEPLNG